MAQAKSKFAGVAFSPRDVELWTAEHPVSAAGFRCLRREFSTFWKKGRIAREVGAHISRCWILQHDGQLAAYITLLADELTGRWNMSPAHSARGSASDL